MASVSVIIVNYNGQRFLDDLFESLARQTRPADEVILVDNASTDGSVAYIREHFPWVRVVPSTANVGFAEGNNIAVDHASGEYLALLNTDTVVDERWLAELADALDADTRIGAAVAKIYLATKEPIIDCAGAEFNNLGFSWGRGATEADDHQFDEAAEVPAATACAMMLRRHTLAGRPLFDSQFFMYYEEFDLSLRIRGGGFTITYVPTAIVHHKRSQAVKGSVGNPLLFQQFYGNRNRVKILLKYYPASLLLRNGPLILLSLLYWNAVILRDGGPRFFLRAIASQGRFAVQGLRERRRGDTVDAKRWLPWMTHQGMRDMLALATGWEAKGERLGVRTRNTRRKHDSTRRSNSAREHRHRPL